MSLAEAKVWNKDSAVKFVLYHGTDREAAASIKKTGFKEPLRTGSTYSLIQPGISLSQLKNVASLYGGEVRLKVLVNVKKVYDGEHRTYAWLKKRGYDATADWDSGEIQVLDKKNIVVLK